MSKPGADPSSGISLGDALRLPKRHPACRRREAQSGSRKKLTGSGHATHFSSFVIISIRPHDARMLIRGSLRPKFGKIGSGWGQVHTVRNGASPGGGKIRGLAKPSRGERRGRVWRVAPPSLEITLADARPDRWLPATTSKNNLELALDRDSAPPTARDRSGKGDRRGGGRAASGTCARSP